MVTIPANDISKHIFLNKNENDRIPIQLSLQFVPRSPIDNKVALVQVMAWRRTGDEPLPPPVLTIWRVYASLGWNELINTVIISKLK